MLRWFSLAVGQDAGSPIDVRSQAQLSCPYIALSLGVARPAAIRERQSSRDPTATESQSSPGEMKGIIEMRATTLREADAIERAKSGDASAFEGLYEHYRHSVYVWCLRMTDDTSDAEDLTQEVFLQVYRKVKSFRGEAAFGSWLYRVTINIAKMYFRKRRVETISLGCVVELNERATGSRLPGRNYFRSGSIERIALTRALSRLSQKRRSIVLLHDMNGLTHREVACRLGVTVSSSKSHLYHAHRKLRAILALRNMRPHHEISPPRA
jgi:RNA polymerase sigma-70 factor, ECF subfamily